MMLQRKVTLVHGRTGANRRWAGSLVAPDTSALIGSVIRTWPLWHLGKGHRWKHVGYGFELSDTVQTGYNG